MNKVKFWNFFLGLVIGFGSGVWIVNAMVPNANELIRIYRLDQKSIMEDKAARPNGTVEIKQ